ncbi:MAG: 2-amino-4-hydroxy-6-hydroxymethyldihydropteridine diphosphokinase [Candidatus Omnitrophica bacterium]|nr:2-amino-4-hydroxy-6-hydroxymethyldihydropteridine diphosphokinase [Candidatus Omnitrophota bacterium]
MAICYLGIGSNLGDRRKNIKLAVKRINALKNTSVLKESRIIESAPVGGPAGQPDFLNAALKIKTKLPPLNLLKELKKIENDLGRVKSVRFGPRVIDLDILLYGDRVMAAKKLTIPHPRLFSRDFVTGPLLEVL